MKSVYWQVILGLGKGEDIANGFSVDNQPSLAFSQRVELTKFDYGPLLLDDSYRVVVVSGYEI